MNNSFPPLPLEEWVDTRNTIQGYAQVLGKVRRALTPFQKHWWHVSLRAAAVGLTTTPIRAENINGPLTFEMILDFISHQLLVTSSQGDWYEIDFDGQSSREFHGDVMDVLGNLGVKVDLDGAQFSDDDGAYDADEAEDFWQAASQIDQVLKEFKSGLRGESGPVQLWPHHFDLAMLWFSGRKVPGYDPNDLEKADYADEQMNFGFSTGDKDISQPYFYITAYPWPKRLDGTDLPGDAYFQTEPFNCNVLPYAFLVASDEPHAYLLNFLRTVHEAGAKLMQD
jgi:hypothetical protein